MKNLITKKQKKRSGKLCSRCGDFARLSTVTGLCVTCETWPREHEKEMERKERALANQFE